MRVKVAPECLPCGFDQVRITNDPSRGGGRPGGKAGPLGEYPLAVVQVRGGSPEGFRRGCIDHSQQGFGSLAGGDEAVIGVGTFGQRDGVGFPQVLLFKAGHWGEVFLLPDVGKVRVPLQDQVQVGHGQIRVDPVEILGPVRDLPHDQDEGHQFPHRPVGDYPAVAARVAGVRGFDHDAAQEVEPLFLGTGQEAGCRPHSRGVVLLVRHRDEHQVHPEGAGFFGGLRQEAHGHGKAELHVHDAPPEKVVPGLEVPLRLFGKGNLPHAPRAGLGIQGDFLQGAVGLDIDDVEMPFKDDRQAGRGLRPHEGRNDGASARAPRDRRQLEVLGALRKRGQGGEVFTDALGAGPLPGRGRKAGDFHQVQRKGVDVFRGVPEHGGPSLLFICRACPIIRQGCRGVNRPVGTGASGVQGSGAGRKFPVPPGQGRPRRKG